MWSKRLTGKELSDEELDEACALFLLDKKDFDEIHFDREYGRFNSTLPRVAMPLELVLGDCQSLRIWPGFDTVTLRRLLTLLGESRR